MRRLAIALLAVVVLSAWSSTALAQKQRRFPPRKPLPYPERVIGVGPVLASAPSARYVAYKYGYRYLPRRVLGRAPVARVLAPGALVIHAPVAPVRVIHVDRRARLREVAPLRPIVRPLRQPLRSIPVRLLPQRR